MGRSLVATCPRSEKLPQRNQKSRNHLWQSQKPRSPTSVVARALSRSSTKRAAKARASSAFPRSMDARAEQVAAHHVLWYVLRCVFTHINERCQDGDLGIEQI